MKMDRASSEFYFLPDPLTDKQTLEKEVVAWQSHRNKHHAKADRRFRRSLLNPTFEHRDSSQAGARPLLPGATSGRRLLRAGAPTEK